jgi:hypothetical protein
MIDEEFREMAGFDRGERETNRLQDKVLRKDRLFSRLAALTFDTPEIIEKMEEALPRWETKEKSEAMSALAGYVLYCRGKFEEAVVQFMDAVTQNAANLDNWLDLAFALHHLEDPMGYAILFNYDEFVRSYQEAGHRACSRDVLLKLFDRIKEQRLDLGSRCREFLPNR